MSPSTASVPAEVETALVGRYNRKVHVLGGLYHLWASNAVERVKAAGRERAQVVGAVMSCGAVERDGAWSYEWAHRAVPIEDAVAVADPCARCFALDVDGNLPTEVQS